jgi:diketogulonate reductase-like aldo/keto reductase
VGETIAGRRDEVFLVSKVLPERASRSPEHAWRESNHSSVSIHRLDRYLLHWRGRHLLEDTAARFEDLRRAGKILLGGQ